MAFTHTVGRTYRDSSGTTISYTETPSADAELNISTQIAASTTNQLIAWAATIANLKSLSLSCDIACTVKTNSSGSPQDTINLLAGQNLIWTFATDGDSHLPFSGNITALYVTNPSSTLPLNFNVRALAAQ